MHFDWCLCWKSFLQDLQQISTNILFGFGLPMYSYPSKFQSPILGRLVIRSSPRKTSDVPRSSKPVTIRRYFTTKRFLKKNLRESTFYAFFLPLMNSYRSMMRYVACCFLGGTWDPKENIPVMRNRRTRRNLRIFQGTCCHRIHQMLPKWLLGFVEVAALLM